MSDNLRSPPAPRQGPGPGAVLPERRLGAMAALVIFNVVISTACQDALFLAHHGKDRIPPAMLFGSLATALSSLLMTRILRRASQAVALRVILVLLGLISGAFCLWNLRPGSVSTFALFLWVELSTTLGVAATWSYFQAPLEPSQMRRLLPRLGAYAGLGGLFALPVSLIVVRRFSPSYLIAVSALAWVSAALLIVRSHITRQQRTRSGGAIGIREILHLPLSRWMILGTAGIVWMGLLVQYETRVALQRSLAPTQIATVMSILMATTAVMGIFIQGLLTTPILERWGVGLALAVLPITIAVLLGLYVPLHALGIIAGAHFINKTLQPNLHRPAESCMLAALSPAARPTLHLLLSSVVGPFLKALGALCLWSVASIASSGAILTVALIITFALSVLSTQWGKIYAQTLQGTLEEGSVDMVGEAAEDEALIPMIDGPRLEFLLQSITKGGPRSRELALEMLRPHRSALVRRAMSELLESKDPWVRIAALRWFAEDEGELVETRDGVQLLAVLRRRWDELTGVPSEIAERVALLYAARAEAPTLLGKDLPRWATHPDVEMRAAVIRALLASPIVPNQVLAREAIARLLSGSTVEERIAGVRLCGERGDVTTLPVLLGLLKSDSLQVRREVLLALPALRSAVDATSQGAVQALWGALSDKELAILAVRALATCGEEVVETAERLLADPQTKAHVRMSVLRLLGQLPTGRGAKVLLKCLSEPDRNAHLEALRSLSHLRRQGHFSPGEAERQEIHTFLLQDLRYGLRIRRARENIRKVRPRTSLVVRELDAQFDAAQQRVFRAHGILVKQDALVPVWNALRATASPHREQARELLRALLGPGPILTGSLQILDETLPWQDECYRAPLDAFQDRSPEAAVGFLRGTYDPWVLAALRHDPGFEGPTEVSAIEPHLEDPMKASLDILLFLKDVALFEALTNQQLVEVAQLAEGVFVPQGTTLFEQGDLPDYLYLVRKGKLIVRAGGQEVARLGPGECAGEMAVLADTERTASVITAEPCQLLRFESNVFKDLLDTFPEIGRGLLKSLVRRLVVTGGARRGVRPMTMTGMVWGPGGPPLPLKREG